MLRLKSHVHLILAITQWILIYWLELLFHCWGWLLLLGGRLWGFLFPGYLDCGEYFFGCAFGDAARAGWGDYDFLNVGDNVEVLDWLRLGHSLSDHEVSNQVVYKAKYWLVLQVPHSRALQRKMICLLEVLRVQHEYVPIYPNQVLVATCIKHIRQFTLSSRRVNAALEPPVYVSDDSMRVAMDEPTNLRPWLKWHRWTVVLTFAHVKSF